MDGLHAGHVQVHVEGVPAGADQLFIADGPELGDPHLVIAVQSLWNPGHVHLDVSD